MVQQAATGDVPPAERVRFLWAAGASAVAVVAFGVFLVANSGTPAAKKVADFGLLGGALVAAWACGRAARRGGAEARAWRLLSVGALIWAAAEVLWTYYGITRDHAYPFPSVADIGFVGWAIPVVLGLLSFPRDTDRLASRLRAPLDAVLIASSVLFVSWSTVLGPLYRSGSESFLSRITALGYPIADIVIASLVLALGMRRPPQARRPWLLLGGGLVTLAVTDSIYVHNTVVGIATSGTGLYAGWVLAFLLVALAALVPTPSFAGRGETGLDLTRELLPYFPFVAALAVSAGRQLSAASDPFLPEAASCASSPSPSVRR